MAQKDVLFDKNNPNQYSQGDSSLYPPKPGSAESFLPANDMPAIPWSPDSFLPWNNMPPKPWTTDSFLPSWTYQEQPQGVTPSVTQPATVETNPNPVPKPGTYESPLPSQWPTIGVPAPWTPESPLPKEWPAKQPYVPPQWPTDQFLFGHQAEQLNQQNPNYINERNQKIQNLIANGQDVRQLSDAELRQKAMGIISQYWGDINDPRMQNTLNNIVGGLRQQAPQYTSNDYFNMLMSNQPVATTGWPAVQNAYLRYQNFNRFTGYSDMQFADALKNGDITPGSQTWKDLTNAWFWQTLAMWQKLSGLRTANDVNSYLYNALNVDPNKPLKWQTEEPLKQPNFETSIAQMIFQSMNTDTATQFKQYVSENKDIVQARDNARGTKTKMDDLNLKLKNLADDMKAQIIAGWWVPTEGYLQALVSEKSKPIIREFEKLQNEYNSQVSVLGDLTDNAKQEFQFAQQDQQNKIKWLEFIQGMYEKQQARQTQAQETQYQHQQDQQKFAFEQQKYKDQQKFEQQKFWLDKQQFEFEKYKFGQWQVEITKDAQWNPVIVNKQTGKAQNLVLPWQYQTSDWVINLKDIPNASTQSQKEALIQYGDANNGLVYQWGWNGKNGIDCSWLLMAFWQASWLIPAWTDMTAATMYKKSQPIELNNLTPGDLIYYQDGNKITHVWIALWWLQNGKLSILDASTDKWWVGRREINVDNNWKLKGTNFTIKWGSNRLTPWWTWVTKSNQKLQQLPAPQAIMLSDARQLPNLLWWLRDVINNNKSSFWPIAWNIWQYNVYDTNTQTIVSQLRTARQLVGKLMEWGVLRAEDEPKYRAMLPDITDTPQLANNKLDLLQKSLTDKYNDYVKSLKTTWYDLWWITEIGSKEQQGWGQAGQVININWKRYKVWDDWDTLIPL